MLGRTGLALLALLPCALTRATNAAERAASDPVSGTVRFEPADNEASLPERFRLEEHTFDFERTPLETSAESIRIAAVTFPSPVQTPHVNNNTVHCEYFRPVAEGRYPAVVVLHILGGDFELARLFARTLAHNGVAALFLKLPYYGPRAQEGGRRRMVTLNPEETARNMTQAVLDIRRARAWLAAQPEIDPDQTGIFGISLGGITCSLAAAAEPRFTKVCPMLAGGDIGLAAWSSPEATEVRQAWESRGGTEESFRQALRPVDPVTYADQLRGRRVLMLNATHDEVIPRGCTDALCLAFGEPEIIWFDAGHYTAVRFIFDGLARVTRFFQPDEPPSM